MSQATIGYGASLTADGTAFFQLMSFTVPTYPASTVDFAPINAGAARELSIAGIQKATEFNFEIVYCRADYVRLGSLKGANKAYVLTLPDEDGSGSITAVTVTCNAFLLKYEVEVKSPDLVVIKCNAKLDGSNITVA